MAEGRIPCDTDGCNHTIGRERYVRQFHHEPGGWICADCWRKVPRSLKRVKARHEREKRRLGFYPREAGYERVLRRIWKIASE